MKNLKAHLKRNVRMGVIKGFGNYPGEIRRDRAVTHSSNWFRLKVTNKFLVEEIIKIPQDGEVEGQIDGELIKSTIMSLSQPLERTCCEMLDNAISDSEIVMEEY